MPDKYYVYLKTKAHNDDGAFLNTIPLLVESVSITTSKSVPSIPIPLSGLITGESLTAALDLGMASKSISLQGVIVGATRIYRTTHNKDTKDVYMTPHEVAQLLHSAVDSTGLAKNQSISELVILMPSNVDETYTSRSGAGQYNESSFVDIPFTYRARGESLQLDNALIPFPLDFPENANSSGLKGFLRSFNCSFEGQTLEISFGLEFEVAVIVP